MDIASFKGGIAPSPHARIGLARRRESWRFITAPATLLGAGRRWPGCLAASGRRGAGELDAEFKRTPGLDQTIGRGEAGGNVEAMNAEARERVKGRSRDIGKEIGLPPRTRSSDMEW